jgi:hypothetical protein
MSLKIKVTVHILPKYTERKYISTSIFERFLSVDIITSLGSEAVNH